VINQKNA